jgi:hypothetical protein
LARPSASRCSHAFSSIRTRAKLLLSDSKIPKTGNVIVKNPSGTSSSSFSEVVVVEDDGDGELVRERNAKRFPLRPLISLSLIGRLAGDDNCCPVERWREASGRAGVKAAAVARDGADKAAKNTHRTVAIAIIIDRSLINSRIFAKRSTFS